MRKANAVPSRVFFPCFLALLPLLSGFASAKVISVTPGEDVIASATWYYLNCTTSAGLGSYTVTIEPTHGTVTTGSTSAPLPGCPAGSPPLPVTIANYTMNNSTPPFASDYFQLNYVLNGNVYGPIDVYVENGNVVGKQLGCGTCNKQLVGDPIDVASGNVFYSVTDYSTAGQNPLAFTRYYNSLGNLATQVPLPEAGLVLSSTLASELGVNWRSSFDRSLKITSKTEVIAERPDGRQAIFELSGSTWKPDTDIDATLTQNGDQWEFKDYDDTVETYTTATLPAGAPAASAYARLNSIRLRNGYTQTLAYSEGELSKVTDSYHRALDFVYSGGLLQSVTTPDGPVVSYSYAAAASQNHLTTVSYSTTPETSQSYVYEIAAQPFALTGIIDENGNRYATWGYDPVGHGTSDQLGNGANATSIIYNSGNSVVTNAFGVQDTYKFRTLQNIPKVVEIDREATTTTAAAKRFFTYDSNGYLTSQTDWNGNKTSYVNDVHGQPTTITEPTRTTTISYDDPVFVHLPHQIVTSGLTTTFGYDGSGNLLTRTLLDTTTTTVPYATRGEQRIWHYTWSNSLLASVQTPRTDVKGLTHFTYDSTGALTEIANALGQDTKITKHTGGGLPEIIVDPNNVTTTLAYDGRLHLHTSTLKTSKGNLIATFNYDPAENLQSVQLPDGSTLTNGYDTAHRLTRVTDLFTQSVAYTLDALGDQTVTNVSDSTNTVKWTHSGEFDALGRMIQDIGGVANQTTVVTYDKNGNALTITDPLTNKTTQGFDALNRLDKITDPAPGGITNITFDTHDRPLTVTAPNGARTAYVYDGFGDAIQVTSPDTGITVNHYDLDGNLTQSTNAARAVANYTYDALDRVLATTYPSDAAENVTYTYDQTGHGFGVGRLTSVADAAGALSRNYDERGNVLSEKRTRTTATLTTVYAYDAASRVASFTYPSKWLVSYSRDKMGRVTGVTATKPGGSATPVVSNVTYEPFGPVTGMTFGNGVAEARSFDLDYRLGTLTDTGTSALQNLTYGYDADNNVNTITNAVTSTNNQTLGYDTLNRLNSAAGGYGTLAYTYDKSGNRLTAKSGPITTKYSYTADTNILNTLAIGTTTTEAFGYTAAGNINSFNPGILGAGSSPITGLTYNQANRLATVSAGTGQVAGYTYDAFGHRIVKTTGTTTLYQHDQAGHLLEEASGSGIAQVDYIYLNGMPIATIAPATGKLYFIHNDRLGTPQLATDSTQAIAWQATYQPFGATTGTVAGLITQNLRLPGQQFDAETGFNHNGFRDYAPGWGRYVESDPIGLAGGSSTYPYSGGRPLNNADPLGLGWLIRTTDGGQYTGDTVSQLIVKINSLGPSSINLLAILGHGDFNFQGFNPSDGSDGNRLVLSDGIIRLENGTQSFPFLSLLDGKLAPDANIKLLGCNVARGSNNVVQALAKDLNDIPIQGCNEYAGNGGATCGSLLWGHDVSCVNGSSGLTCGPSNSSRPGDFFLDVIVDGFHDGYYWFTH